MRTIYFSLFIILMLVAGCADTPDQATSPNAVDSTALPDAADAPNDLAALESAYVETPLRNEYVDVHRISLPTGASIAPHEGGPRVVYALSNYEVRFQTDDESETQSFEQGNMHFHRGGVHTVENTGASSAEFVIVERREGTLPPAKAEGATDIPESPEGAEEEELLNNETAQAHRVTLQPGAQLPSHRGYARVIYSLSGYTIAFSSDDGTREHTFAEGDVHFHDPGEHTVENVGDTMAEFLVVEFKQ